VRFALREATCSDISSRLIGIVATVAQAKRTDVLHELLGELLKGANIRPSDFVREIAENVPPHALAADAMAGDPARLMDVDRSKTGKEERALRVLTALRASGRVFDLQIADLEDEPTIALKVGAELHPTSKVSLGERCTAILPIVLLDSASPLVIDQPEDHLDNAFIYEVLVKSVARAKAGRQIIFATHNPNLPVLGDAEQVLVVKTNEDGGYLANAGSVDATRDDIEQILEGGREAFLRRSERYGHAIAR
jgi:hypothetical protein